MRWAFLLMTVAFWVFLGALGAIPESWSIQYWLAIAAWAVFLVSAEYWLRGIIHAALHPAFRARAAQQNRSES